MPKGGPRVNSGRPLGAVAAKHQITANTIVETTDGYLPLAYMLALMRDEQAEPQRRDAMAIQAAPYCHARLTAVTNTGGVAGKNGDTINNIVQIFAVPRGAALDVKEGTVTIDGNQSTDLQALVPYEGTPPLRGDTADCSLQTNTPQPVPGPRPEPLPVYELDTDNVTRLDQYRDKDGD